MKLLKLEILNLASLDKGEGEVINFEEGALGESTIFSIVGPTGSGKSTILDAICLALYNRAPRYPRKKNDKGKIEIFGEQDPDEANRLAPTDGRNILSRGKKIGYSKLTFRANNGDVYRAEWHVSKARVRYNDVETHLYKIVGCEDGWKEECCAWSNLPQIIGLDYEQFLRTVLIAQGSFANFLDAKENDRYELLEKLVGCEDMYTRIFEEIKLKKDESESAYNKIKSQMELYEKDDLSPEELQALNQKIEELEEAEKKRVQELETIGKALAWYTDEEKYQDNIRTYKLVWEAAKAALDDMKERTDRLALHDATLQAVDLYKEQKSKGESLRQIAEELHNLSDESTKKNQEIGLEEKSHQDLEKKLKEAATQLSAQRPLINKARTVKVECEAAKINEEEKNKTQAKAKEELDDAKKKLDTNQESINKKTSDLTNAQKNYDELKESVDKERETLKKQADEAVQAYEQEVKQLEGKKMEDLLKAKDEATACLHDLKEAIRILQGWKEKENQKAELEAEKEKFSKLNEEIEKECAQLSIESLRKELEVLQKANTLLTSQEWNMHRQSLEEGKPCKLCGAKHHPFQQEDEFKPFVSEMNEQIEKKKKELDGQTDREKSLLKDLNENKGKLKSLAGQLATLDKEMAKCQSDWKDISVKHVDWKADAESLEAMQKPMDENLQQAQKALDDYQEIFNKAELLRTQKERIEKKLKNYLEQSELELKKLETRKTDAVTALETEKAKTENLETQFKEKEEALAKAASEQTEAQEKVIQKLKELKELIGDKDPDALEKELENQLDNAEVDVKNKEKKIAGLKELLAGLVGNIQTLKKRQQQDKAVLDEKEQQLSRWLEDYNAEESYVQKLAVEDIIALSQATDNWEAVRKEMEAKKQAHTSAETTYKNEEKAHLAHQQSKPSEEKEDLVTKKQQLEDKDRDELAAARARLQRYQDTKKAMGDMYEQKQHAEQVMRDWKDISEAVGGSDGKLLRKIAQCYTLGFLVEHANAEIRKFNQRYELVQVKNSLGIRVIDHDRADDVRDTTSLSGGETFIVSLGLALGLSALSSRSISFENLFIDEGFGTLDPDTLATVLDSLAMLQTSQGKKVGVISHTDTMSERITTQIRVIKNGNTGSSRIEVYP